ncbi:MAG TPA: NAD(+)/NADH kinase [Acidobacteriota bacterium]|jgi:NAD+ kinase|nr:NAD(+)/NADH kinase [Acidobacteriota bacterium]
MKIRTLGIVAKYKPEVGPILARVVRWMQDQGVGILVDSTSAKLLDFKVPRASLERLPFRSQAIVALGGDGTILAVARSIQNSGTPILAVNLGSLGFLTEIKLDELYPALSRVIENKFFVDVRYMIDSSVKRKGKILARHTALNDVVINKGAPARIIQFEAFSNRDYIASFLADGLIISTPTGSTAYSLSAGGPVVYPNLECLVLTPICPHTLTNRPLVIPLDSKVRVILRQGEEVMLTVDGQVGMRLQLEDEITVTRSRSTVKLIHPENKNYFDVLREKLKWGAR